MQKFLFAQSTAFPLILYNAGRITKEVVSMEKIIRFNRDEQKAIVRGLYDMRNAMAHDDPQKKDLEPLILRVIDAPEVEPFWRRWIQ